VCFHVSSPSHTAVPLRRRDQAARQFITVRAKWWLARAVASKVRKGTASSILKVVTRISGQLEHSGEVVPVSTQPGLKGPGPLTRQPTNPPASTPASDPFTAQAVWHVGISSSLVRQRAGSQPASQSDREWYQAPH
jgi:hypothetical protein